MHHTLHAGRWAAMLIALFTSLSFAQGSAPADSAKPIAVTFTERVQICASCHGTEGNSQTNNIPSIAGQPRIFMENVLVLIREGLRSNEVMQAVTKGMSDQDIVALAKHFSALPVQSTPGEPDTALQQRGRLLASKLRCASCHEANFKGRAQMPRLAAQRGEVLLTKLIAFRDKPKPGTDTIMNATLHGVKDDELKALAHFLAHVR